MRQTWIDFNPPSVKRKSRWNNWRNAEEEGGGGLAHQKAPRARDGKGQDAFGPLRYGGQRREIWNISAANRAREKLSAILKDRECKESFGLEGHDARGAEYKQELFFEHANEKVLGIKTFCIDETIVEVKTQNIFRWQICFHRERGYVAGWTCLAVLGNRG